MSSLFGQSIYKAPTGSMTGVNKPSGGLSGSSQGMGNKIPKGYELGQIQQFTPEMMELFKSLFSHLSTDSNLSRLAAGDPERFQEVEEPAFRNFSALQGNIASKFSGAGGLGARRSSGFQNTMNAAASNFAQDLASQRQQLSRQALQDLMSHSQMLLGQKPYEQQLIKKQQPNTFGNIVGGALPVAGALAGGYFGGLPGAQLGGQIGAWAGKGFMSE